MEGRPKVSFTFPFRWLKDDRKYLAENLKKQINLGSNKQAMHPYLSQPAPQSFYVILKQHAFQPKGYNLKKEELEELVSPSLMGARMVGYEKFFVQTNSRTSLPVMEMEIYF